VRQRRHNGVSGANDTSAPCRAATTTRAPAASAAPRLANACQHGTYVAPEAPCVVLLPKHLSGREILIAMSLARSIRVAPLVGGDREPTARFTELGVSSA
jgi:hypothetical protein